MKRRCSCGAIKLRTGTVMRETIEPGMIVLHSRKECRIRPTR